MYVKYVKNKYNSHTEYFHQFPLLKRKVIITCLAVSQILIKCSVGKGIQNR